MFFDIFHNTAGSSFFNNFQLVEPKQISILRSQRDLYGGNHSKVVSVFIFNNTFTLNLKKWEDFKDPNIFYASINENISKKHKDYIEIYYGYVYGSNQKSFLYWENGLLFGNIHVSSSVSYYIEPAWRHIKTESKDKMIAYRNIDLKLDNKNLAQICKAMKAPDLTPEIITRKRRDTGAGSRCPILLVADYAYFKNVGGGSFSTTVKYMIGIITRINEIYLSTNFSASLSNLGMTVKGVIVHSTPGGASYNVQKDWTTTDFLTEFGRNVEANNFCLAHLFTFQDFGSVLGLAWLASDKAQSQGGICSSCYNNMCYNTAWSTNSLNGQKLPALQADIVTAHEIGHGWGSSHDPDDCAPSTANGGKFLMYPYSVSGYNDNNKKFSECSKKSITSVLHAKMAYCFTGESSSFCGNGKVEVGEECDGAGANQTCCDANCKFTSGSICSDVNSECCTNCKYSDTSKICRKADNNTCDVETHCQSQSAICPSLDPKNNGEPCGFHGQCNGRCKSYCEINSKKDCACDGVDSCYLCCKNDDNSICLKADSNIRLPDNAPCLNGVCNKGICMQSIVNRNPRAWDIINHLKIDSVATFMRNNLVLATIILSAIPYAFICLIIWCYDRKKLNKEEKALEWFNNSNEQLFPENYNTQNIKIVPFIK